ncbi:hypothetical protein JW835_13425 [bacterium]|nr:hypothetical protein [bacterium]
MSKAKEIVRLTGVITVTESDRKGKPLEIGIETDDFLTYVITCKRKGRELFKHISKRVSITCKIEGKNYFGNALISVIDYLLLKEGNSSVYRMNIQDNHIKNQIENKKEMDHERKKRV